MDIPNYTLSVQVGDATMAVANPLCTPHIEWIMRHGTNLNDASNGRYSAASLIASYTYLLSDEISTKETVRRLRILRGAIKAYTGRNKATT